MGLTAAQMNILSWEKISNLKCKNIREGPHVLQPDLKSQK